MTERMVHIITAIIVGMIMWGLTRIWHTYGQTVGLISCGLFIAACLMIALVIDYRQKR